MQKVAQVLKSNGSDGQLLVSFTVLAPEDIDLQEPVFIEADGLPVPYFFESFQPRGRSRALVRLTGIRSQEDADEVAGKDLLLPDEAVEEDDDTLTGFTVVDAATRQTVGCIMDGEDIPGNPCIWVERPGGQQILLPLHEDLIAAVDAATETLHLHIPEGLLDM